MSFLSRIIGSMIFPAQTKSYGKVTGLMQINHGKAFKGGVVTVKEFNKTSDEIKKLKSKIISDYSNSRQPHSHQSDIKKTSLEVELEAAKEAADKEATALFTQFNRRISEKLKRRELSRVNMFCPAVDIRQSLNNVKNSYLTNLETLEASIEFYFTDSKNSADELKRIQKECTDKTVAMILGDMINKYHPKASNNFIVTEQLSDELEPSLMKEEPPLDSLIEIEFSLMETLRKKYDLEQASIELKTQASSIEAKCMEDKSVLAMIEEISVPLLIKNVEQERNLEALLEVENKRELINARIKLLQAAQKKNYIEQAMQYADYKKNPHQYLIEKIPYFKNAAKNNLQKKSSSSIKIYDQDIDMANSHIKYLSRGFDIDARTVSYQDDSNAHGRKKSTRQISLETIEITPPNLKEVPQKNRNYILYFAGNAQYMDSNLLSTLAELAENMNATVIGFNHRSVGRANRETNGISRVDAFEELVQDGIAQANELFRRKIDPSQLTAFGHSLGGSVAVAVGAHFHGLVDEPKKMYVAHGRSFINIADPIKYQYEKSSEPAVNIPEDREENRPQRNRKKGIIYKIKAWFGNYLAKLVANNSWDIDVLAYAKKIDPNYIFSYSAAKDKVIPVSNQRLGPEGSHMVFDVHQPEGAEPVNCHVAPLSELYIPTHAGKEKLGFYEWFRQTFQKRTQHNNNASKLAANNESTSNTLRHNPNMVLENTRESSHGPQGEGNDVSSPSPLFKRKNSSLGSLVDNKYTTFQALPKESGKGRLSINNPEPSSSNGSNKNSQGSDEPVREEMSNEKLNNRHLTAENEFTHTERCSLF